MQYVLITTKPSASAMRAYVAAFLRTQSWYQQTLRQDDAHHTARQLENLFNMRGCSDLDMLLCKEPPPRQFALPTLHLLACSASLDEYWVNPCNTQHLR